MSSDDDGAIRSAGDEMPLSPSPGLRERVLAVADPSRRFHGFTERVARLFDVSPSRAVQILEAAAHGPGESWEEGLAPGVRLFHLEGGDEVATADCGLVRLEPGASVPAHRHRGLEICFVLSGAASEDGSGEIWEPGDLVIRDAGSRHAFRAVGDEPYLFAVVLHGGLELDPD